MNQLNHKGAWRTCQMQDDLLIVSDVNRFCPRAMFSTAMQIMICVVAMFAMLCLPCRADEATSGQMFAAADASSAKNLAKIFKAKDVEIIKENEVGKQDLSYYGYIQLPSPDEKLKALIKAQNKQGETHLEIQKEDGTVLCKQDFTSEDTEHGLVANRAAWSPDSNFFYFTMRSSGGHMPWKATTRVYSRDKNKLFDIEDFLPPMAPGGFSIESPDILHVLMWTRNADGVIESVLPITFRLSDLFRDLKPESE